MKKNILAVLFIVAFAIVAIVLLTASVGEPKMKGVECISIIVIEEDINEEISNNNEIELITKVFSKRLLKNTPSCPFGYIEITLEGDNNKTSVFPATDGCHIFKIDNQYFQVTDSEWETLMNTFSKYGVSRSLFEDGKGI